MSGAFSRDPDSAAWERVARSYLRAPRAPRFRVGLAGTAPEEELRLEGSALREGARRLGSSGIDPVVVHELGPVSERRLDRLAKELPEEIDLLFWVNERGVPDPLRGSYLLGIFAWATDARRILCPVPEGTHTAEGARFREALSRCGGPSALEFPPRSRVHADPRWWQAQLQAAMAREDALRRRSPGSTPSEGSGSAA